MKLFDLIGLQVLYHHRFQVSVALELLHGGIQSDLDRTGMFRELVLKDPACSQLVPDFQHRDLAGKLSQEKTFLDSAVSTTDHHHLLAFVERAVAGGAEMDADADQVLFPGHIEPTITAAGVQQYGGGAVFIACFSGDHLGLAAAVNRGDRLGLENLDIEPLRMDPHLVGEIRARDSFS